MGYPIFHSQYTAAQIEASIGKTPRIKASTRTWEIWDIATSAYVDTGVSIDTQLYVDPTLTESGYAADAKVTGDSLGELKSATRKEEQRLRNGVFVNPCPNLKDYETATQSNLYGGGSGNLEISAIYRSFYIPISVEVGDVITITKTAGAIFRAGTTLNQPAEGVAVEQSVSDNSSSALQIIISTAANWLYVVYWRSDHDTISRETMFESINVYYGTENNNIPIVESIGVDVERLNGYFVRRKSENLFDKSQSVDGKYVDPRNGSINNNNNQFYAYIPIYGAGTYRFLGNSTLFGTTKVKEIPLFDAEKTYKTYISGSHFGDGTGTLYGVEFTITSAMITSGYKYFTLSQHKDNKNEVMVVKDISYPATYIPYYDYIELVGVEVPNSMDGKKNPLYTKTALFFGDSICNGSSAGDGQNGYAGRIGEANSMDWHNLGVNGATVTQISGHSCIGSAVVSAASTYSSPDYVILEGGTNDADNLHEEGLGTYTANDYSGSYDTATFSGAFETMLYNAVQQWPHAQVGYISAHKMGNGDNRARRRLFFERAQELCEKWGVPFIDLWTETKLNRDLSAQYDSSMTSAENIEAHKLYTDGQHLTPDGYDLITPVIDWWMCGL